MMITELMDSPMIIYVSVILFLFLLYTLFIFTPMAWFEKSICFICCKTRVVINKVKACL